MSDQTAPDPKQIIAHSQLPAMIARLESVIKTIPQDQIAALESIAILTEILGAYAHWTSSLKIELQKLDGLNKSQAELIRNLKKIEVC